ALNRPRSDEVGAGAGDESKADDQKAASSTPLKFDVDGFNERVTALDVPAGNHVGLAASKGGVFFVSTGGNGAELRYYDLEKRAAESVLAGVTGYSLSADGKKLLWRQQDKFGIADAKPGIEADKTALKLERLEMRVDPQREWQQMYVDGWR